MYFDSIGIDIDRNALSIKEAAVFAVDYRVTKRFAEDFQGNFQLIDARSSSYNGSGTQVPCDYTQRFFDHLSKSSIAELPVKKARFPWFGLSFSCMNGYVYAELWEELLRIIAGDQQTRFGYLAVAIHEIQAL